VGPKALRSGPRPRFNQVQGVGCWRGFVCAGTSAPSPINRVEILVSNEGATVITDRKQGMFLNDTRSHAWIHMLPRRNIVASAVVRAVFLHAVHHVREDETILSGTCTTGNHQNGFMAVDFPSDVIDADSNLSKG
jgi:hypothetical protein